MTFVASMEPNRLDIFGVGDDRRMYRKAWVGNAPQGNWEDLGGRFDSRPAVVSWGPNRLDIFGLSRTAGVYGMYHKAWDGNTWQPSQLDWDDLGRSRPGVFVGPPAVVARGPNRLDIFAVNSHGAVGDNAMYHKGWDGNSWQPSGWEWHNLGGTFAHLF